MKKSLKNRFGKENTSLIWAVVIIVAIVVLARVGVFEGEDEVVTPEGIQQLVVSSNDSTSLKVRCKNPLFTGSYGGSFPNASAIVFQRPVGGGEWEEIVSGTVAVGSSYTGLDINKFRPATRLYIQGGTDVGGMSQLVEWDKEINVNTELTLKDCPQMAVSSAQEGKYKVYSEMNRSAAYIWTIGDTNTTGWANDATSMDIYLDMDEAGTTNNKTWGYEAGDVVDFTVSMATQNSSHQLLTDDTWVWINLDDSDFDEGAFSVVQDNSRLSEDTTLLGQKGWLDEKLSDEDHFYKVNPVTAVSEIRYQLPLESSVSGTPSNIQVCVVSAGYFQKLDGSMEWGIVDDTSAHNYIYTNAGCLTIKV